MENNWTTEIQELEAYFKDFPFPKQEIIVTPFSKITNSKKFYETNLLICKKYQGNLYFLPYLHRLLDLKGFFETERQALNSLSSNPLQNRI